MFTKQSQGDNDPNDVEFCSRYSKHLHSGLLTFEEYGDKVTTTLIGTQSEYIPRCLDTIPPEVLGRYAEYLRAMLIPVDFMPHPFIFFMEKNTEAERERLKRLRRPQYIAIYEGVLSRLPKTESHAV